MNLPEGAKDGRYKNNHKNDTCIARQIGHCMGVTL